MRALMTGLKPQTHQQAMIQHLYAPSSTQINTHILPFRFKLLETKLESTLKSTLEIKEEKIAALEARLQESSNLNQQLRQELKTVSDSILKVFHVDA